MDIWQETLALRFGDIDRSDRLTLASTFNYFQEVAICHAENLGVGREAMARTGQGWILSRISVVLERRPCWGETITVRSWPRGWDRLFAVRDYDIRDAADKVVVRGRSNWLILDVEKRRPLRPQAVMSSLPLNEGRDALPGGAGALKSREGLVKAAERRALYSDIDSNGHVNNARYIQWIQDLTGPEILEPADRMRLDINYLSEIKLGELTELWTGPLEDAEPASDLPVGFDSGLDQPAASDQPLGFAQPAAMKRPPAAAVEGRREGGQAVFRAELRAWNDAG
ncbi:MAG: acyl-ACP thioesterase [Spirochaetaceae bacterium]|jgi:acyl-ACP thioesterase|nr:acyl-ACP thioesterase [Spirochaetaceae bacterium]